MAGNAIASDREVLEFIHDLFLDPRRWIKGRAATNADGRTVSSSAQEAACFCLTGALTRYAEQHHQRRRLETLLIRHLPHRSNASLIGFNDAQKTTVDDVRSLLKCAVLDYK